MKIKTLQETLKNTRLYSFEERIHDGKDRFVYVRYRENINQQ